MYAGTVKWFNNAKGFGFIISPEHDEDLFAHYSAIFVEGYKSLKAGQHVQFPNILDRQHTPDNRRQADPASIYLADQSPIYRAGHLSVPIIRVSPAGRIYSLRSYAIESVCLAQSGHSQKDLDYQQLIERAL